MTGFRVAYGGAQQLYKIKPDLTCLGKVIGGGLPVGAFGGKREIMQKIAPIGPIYQAGTLSGNPLAMTAGIETLKLLAKPGVYKTLEKNCRGARAGAPCGGSGSGRPGHVQPCRLHVHRVLHGQEGEGFRERQDIGYRRGSGSSSCPCSRTA